MGIRAMGAFVRPGLRRFPQFLHVRGCMRVCACACARLCVFARALVCVFARVPACINSLRSGWLCSQTPQSGCVATNSPPLPRAHHNPPPQTDTPLLFRASVSTGGGKRRIFPAPSSRAHLRHHVIGVFDLSVSVCAMRCAAAPRRARYLWIPQSGNMKEGHRGRSPPPTGESSSVQPG